MHITVTLLKQLVFKNKYCRYGKPAKKKRVNLEYFDNEVNLGDVLSPVICNWMLDKFSLSFDKKTARTHHLMAVGSILGGNGFFDATVWGSGIKGLDQIASLSKRRYFQKLDIRSIRGPLTREALIACGYKCPEVYGDPAVLMPHIYNPSVEKTCEIGVVLHFKHNVVLPADVKSIDICTDDYKKFINDLSCCKKIISSSLHGIILAETYGVPTVFWAEGRDSEMFKYYDWYYSTGRKNIKMAFSLEEAIKMAPMELPDIAKMQNDISSAFPYDLWDS